MASKKSSFTTKKPWALKMQQPAQVVIETLTTQKGPNYPPGRMLIATPMAIDKLLRQIPEGSLLTTAALRQQLAEEYNADYTCPLTTGIFLRIAAEYANEQLLQGATDVSPFWRVVRDDYSLIDKLPGGVERQAELLAAEGYTFAPKGKSGLRVKV